MINNKVIIVGGFVEVIELCEVLNKNIVGIIDNELSESYLNYPVLGKDSDAQKIFNKHKDVLIVITPDNPQIRKKLFELYSSIGFKFCTLIHPNVSVSKSVIINEGAIVQQHVNISSNSQIGKFCKLNTFSNIMHDCMIKDFTTIAPNAVLLGRVKVESLVYIGANSTILPEISIKAEAIVGAGSVVTKDVAKNVTVLGNPAKEKIG
ncbi:MAG: NeuD/PglB/VioB family sugar acetyltransferase [Bacteroidetes bacterium]|jgi:sugar O-acyltransferase (sialic acid O-acetyltransferase NeuD family)|nr:NeuD/PglB/VioB family sugar acetyltransferase [Bacteroidota bacterium]MBT7995290.1 NeuD/PglB/VioB family sugar acetyltransferase [Bacteroidota bacterium]